MFCKRAFGRLHRAQKVRHHDHLVHPVYAKEKVDGYTKYTCTSGNYIGASCLACNFRVTQKRADTSMLFHNFSGYDSSVLLPGMVKCRERLKKN